MHYFFNVNIFYANVVQLTTLLDIVVGGRLGVNFFPSTATSDFAGPPRTGLFLIEIGVIRVGWVIGWSEKELFFEIEKSVVLKS